MGGWRTQTVAQVKALKFEATPFEYTERDLILYALGVYVPMITHSHPLGVFICMCGSVRKWVQMTVCVCGRALTDGATYWIRGASRHDLPLVYENADGFTALPSFAVVPPFRCQVAIPFGDFLPRFDFVRAHTEGERERD
jgi:hypothetical protein